ncbi:MAG: FAD-dependent oxidoreductase [Kiritimatiellaeota bacterium]|nr:FAD-dependent oxidoreductase [Kiritimatiellota bacterium]
MKKLICVVAGCLLVAGATAWAGNGMLVEAEAFADKGGWSVDQQFVEQMGSPYLLAHGLGRPVKNASTSLTIATAGSYRVWVRTKNWVPGDWTAPGRFKVLINGRALAPEFGTLTGWQWQDGGTVALTAGAARIELEDLTGFDGRCDAIYLTTDASERPPDDLKKMRAWRDELSGLPAVPPSAGKFDVVVVGGGIAGCAAALAAAEQGLAVALIHDRPILGGNASGEVRVHTEGITGYATRLLKGINSDHWPNGSERALADDQRRQATLNAATNVHQFLGWRAYGVATNGNRIVSANARHIETGEAKSFTAPVFIDSTGDGWIGYWAGAEYRYGREASAEFDEGWVQHGEQWSPTNTDNRVMGTSLLWNSVAAATPQSFPDVPWAKAVAKTNSAIKGEWFWEFSRNDLDQIADAEEIRDHMLRAIYGSFANAKQNPKHVFQALRFVGYINGKRESRRLMGDYIYTLKDMTEGRTFADAVVTETRAVDVHLQKIYKDPKAQQDFLSTALFKKTPRYYIPFRSLYSKNISNLMMAGRDFSCSHIGLGGPRVMNTCGQMGAATGYAAALMKKHNTTPRGVCRDHLDELLKLVRPSAEEVASESGKGKKQSPQILVHGPGDELQRVRQQYDLVSVPPAVREATCLIPPRGSAAKPAPGYRFTVNTPVEVWIAVHQRGKPALSAEWKKTKDTLLWGEDGVDVLYHRSFPAGLVVVPGHSGKEGSSYGFPHLTFVRPSGATPPGGFQITDPLMDDQASAK